MNERLAVHLCRDCTALEYEKTQYSRYRLCCLDVLNKDVRYAEEKRTEVFELPKVLI